MFKAVPTVRCWEDENWQHKHNSSTWWLAFRITCSLATKTFSDCFQVRKIICNNRFHSTRRLVSCISTNGTDTTIKDDSKKVCNDWTTPTTSRDFLCWTLVARRDSTCRPSFWGRYKRLYVFALLKNNYLQSRIREDKENMTKVPRNLESHQVENRHK